MPRSKGPKKARKSPYKNLKSKFYTHTGGRKGKSGLVGGGKKKRKHGR